MRSPLKKDAGSGVWHLRGIDLSALDSTFGEGLSGTRALTWHLVWHSGSVKSRKAGHPL